MGRLQAKLDASRFSSISFDSQRIKADGKSFCEVSLRLKDTHKNEPITLNLTAGSFAPKETLRQVTLNPEEGEVRFRIFAPSRPRSGYLFADGLRAPLQFSPANLFQFLGFELVPNLLIAIILALFVRSFAIASYFIPSQSMEPTLLIRDRLLANRFSYKFHLAKPSRGDIVIFRYPGDERQDFIKRVIGLPGDRVRIEDGVVYVNGEPLEEPYIAEKPAYDMPEEIVPDGSYFVLGDNRNRSADSHIWGFVPEENLVGKALVIYWPPGRIRIIKNPLIKEG